MSKLNQLPNRRLQPGKEYGERSETIITDAKYGFIDGALKETYREPKKTKGKASGN
jgi:hypothetical protein